MDEQNLIPGKPVVPSPTPEPSHHKGMKKWTALTAFVLIMGVAAAGAYYLKQKAPPVVLTPPVSPVPTPEPTPPTYPDQYTPPDLFEGKNRNYPYAEPKVSGLVTWHYPERVQNLNIFNENKDIPYLEENKRNSYFYELGTINSGKYKDYKLYLGAFACEAMCPPARQRIAAKAGPKPVFLQKYSDPIDNISVDLLDKSKYLVDSTFTISDLDYPRTLKGPGTNQDLKISTPGFFQSATYIPFEISNIIPAFNDPALGQIFTSDADREEESSILNSSGFYAKAPDWSLKVYEMVPNFVNDEGLPDVTWSDGSKNQTAYVYKDLTGCGSSNYASVMPPAELNIQKDLNLVGLTGKGEAVFEFKDSNHRILKEIYDVKYNPYGEPKLPYAEFLKRHPVFFWTDPFNRLVKFENSAFQPMAECAKPAIYLYPTKTTQVSVKVDPQGGFTYTDPDYGTGWNVTAKPDGTIIANGKEYPYLFWEGRGGLYQTPDRGFVVAQADVHNFLVEKLAKLGLNQKESADFIEYWEPYMQGSPYYFVTFMGNYALDQIAPLQVTPKPDTIIRVLMDFQPLDKPIQVRGFDIQTPERKGFTVIEWGGVKH